MFKNPSSYQYIFIIISLVIIMEKLSMQNSPQISKRPEQWIPNFELINSAVLTILLSIGASYWSDIITPQPGEHFSIDSRYSWNIHCPKWTQKIDTAQSLEPQGYEMDWPCPGEMIYMRHMKCEVIFPPS